MSSTTVVTWTREAKAARRANLGAPTSGVVIRTSSILPPTSASASLILAQQIPTAPAWRCMAAMIRLLCVLACGRSRWGLSAQRAIIAAMLASVLVGVRGGEARSRDQACDKGAEQGPPAPARIVNELEGAEIERQLVL